MTTLVLHSSTFSQFPILHLGGSIDAERGGNTQKTQWKRGVPQSMADPHTRKAAP